MKFVLFFIFFSIIQIKIILASNAVNNNPSYCIKHSHIKKIPVNIRLGPSVEYKIIYETQQSFLPIKVQYEHPDNWCYVKFADNKIKGWVMCSALATRSNLSSTNSDAILYRIPNNIKQKIATVKAKTRVNIIQCRGLWCQIKIFKRPEISGFIERQYIWNIDCIMQKTNIQK
jgi:SH3-like domain-containing protein